MLSQPAATSKSAAAASASTAPAPAAPAAPAAQAAATSGPRGAGAGAGAERAAERVRGHVYSLLLSGADSGKGGKGRGAAAAQAAAARAARALTPLLLQEGGAPPPWRAQPAWPALPLRSVRPRPLAFRDPGLPTPEGEAPAPPQAAELQRWAALGASRQPHEAVQRATWQMQERFAASGAAAAAWASAEADQEAWDARRGRAVRLLGPTLASFGDARRLVQLASGEAAAQEGEDVWLVPRDAWRAAVRDHRVAALLGEAGPAGSAPAFDVPAYVAHLRALRAGEEVVVVFDVPAEPEQVDARVAAAPAPTGGEGGGGGGGLLRLTLRAPVRAAALAGDAAMSELALADALAPWRSGAFVFSRRAWVDAGRPLFSRRRAATGRAPVLVRLGGGEGEADDAVWPRSAATALAAPPTSVPEAWAASGLLAGAAHSAWDPWTAADVEARVMAAAAAKPPTAAPAAPAAPDAPATPDAPAAPAAGPAGAEADPPLPEANVAGAPLLRSARAAAAALAAAAAEDRAFLKAAREELAAEAAELREEADQHPARPARPACAPGGGEPSEAEVAQGRLALTRLVLAASGALRVQALPAECVDASGVRGAALRLGADALDAALAAANASAAPSVEDADRVLRRWLGAGAALCARPAARWALVGRRAAAAAAADAADAEEEDEVTGEPVLRLALGFEDGAHYRRMPAAHGAAAGAPRGVGVGVGAGAGEAEDGGPGARELLAALLEVLAGQQEVRADAATRVLARHALLAAAEDGAAFAQLRARVADIKRRRAQLQQRVRKQGAEYEAFEARLVQVVRAGAAADRVRRTVVLLCALLAAEESPSPSQRQRQRQGQSGSRARGRAATAAAVVGQEAVLGRAAHAVLQAFLGEEADGQGTQGGVAAAGGAAGKRRPGRAPTGPLELGRLIAERHAALALPAAGPSTPVPPAPAADAWDRFRPLGALAPLPPPSVPGLSAATRLLLQLHEATAREGALLLAFNRKPLRFVANACCRYAVAPGGSAWAELSRAAPALRAPLAAVLAAAPDARPPTLPRTGPLPRRAVEREGQEEGGLQLLRMPAATVVPPAPEEARPELRAALGAAAAAVERLLRAAVGPSGGLAAAVEDGLGSAPSAAASGPGAQAGGASARSGRRARPAAPPTPAAPAAPAGPAALAAELAAALHARVRPDRVDGWAAVLATYGLAPADQPAAPWVQAVASAAAFLREDVAVTLRRLLAPERARGAWPVDAALPARVLAHEPASELRPLRDAAARLAPLCTAASAALTAAAAAPGAQGGAASAALVGLCASAALGAPLALLGAAAGALEEPVAGLCAGLLRAWAARLAFGRPDLRGEEQARLSARREAEKMRKMGVAQRLDDAGRDLVREMKRMRVGGVDWAAIDRDLAAEAPPAGAEGAGRADVAEVASALDDVSARDEDGMDDFWGA